MRFKRFDKITGDHAAVISAMVKLDALAYDYLRPDELSHQNKVIEPSSNIYFAENLAHFLRNAHDGRIPNIRLFTGYIYKLYNVISSEHDQNYSLRSEKDTLFNCSDMNLVRNGLVKEMVQSER
jgi:hypothetical protein